MGVKESINNTSFICWKEALYDIYWELKSLSMTRVLFVGKGMCQSYIGLYDATLECNFEYNN